ncbi:S-layer homology domain-containing protein [Paenibacillus sinopodophylli]|uniref:S-layer homology domain-containing protein n=1 Tax=Paenibacillus sinopodophylli TaxID=1837342 RepID=UPI00110CB52B|nr:S-layer homology domain-containing protein [Paenibacillus sinopodophylli]
MKKAIKSKKWIALLLSAVVALPVFGASSAVAAPEPAGISATQDYFGSKYEALAGKDHVFETLTYYELDYLLRNATNGTEPAPDDNYILLFGGSWQPETQAAIGYINDVAKEYGVTSIKNFDTKLDGPDGWVDIARPQEPNYEIDTGGTATNPNTAASAAQNNKSFSIRYVDLAARYLKNLNGVTAGNSGKLAFTYTGEGSPGAQEVNVVDSPFLFIYNKNNKDAEGKPTPIIASLEGISSAGSLAALQNGSGADAYKTALRGVFDKISPAGTKNANYKVLTNQSYISGSYNEFRTVSVSPRPATPVIFSNEDPKIVIDSVTLDELKFTLSSEGTHALLIGCAWCGDTQGIVKYVNQVANEYGIEKVYNFDAKLDGGIGSSPGNATNPRPTWGDTSGTNFLHTRQDSWSITPIYVNLVNEYLQNIISENTIAGTKINYYKNAAAKANSTPTTASRVQAPYVLVYNKNNKDANGNPAPILGHVELMGYWNATHDNANAKNLKVNSLRTLFSRTELTPSGLTAVPPTTEGGEDAKIEGIANVTTIGGSQVIATKSLEYKLKDSNEEYTPVPYKATEELLGTSITGLKPGVYEFRYAAKPGFHSEADNFTTVKSELYAPGPVVEIIVPDFQAAPTNLTNLPPESASGQGEIVSIVNGEEVALPAGLEYKLKGAPDSSYEPVTGDSISVEPGQEYVVRFAAKIENGITYAPSAFVTLYARGYKELAPPSALSAVHPSTIANDDGQIDGLTAGVEYKSEYTLEYKKGNGTEDVYVTVPETAISAGKLTGLTPDLYTVRYATYEDFSASPAVELRIKANVAAPQGLAGVAPTNTLQNSGKITGVNAGLEYRSVNQSTYQPVTGTEITGLLIGGYEVRYKETLTTLPSATVTVIVPEYVAPPTGGTGGTGGGSVGTTTPDNITQSGNTVVATVASKVDEASGTAVALVPAATVTGLLDKAKQAEAEGKKAVLEIKVEDSEQKSDIQVTVPRSAFNGLVSGANAELKITVGIGSITFDASTLKSISANSDSGDISFIISKSELAEENKEVLGDRPVYDLTVFAGQSIITTFGGSKVFVSLPYTLKAGEDPNALIVYYVTDEGELQVIRGHYNKTNAAVEYATEHFSQYIIGYNKIDFSDVAASAWYAPAINFLAARDITSGTDASHFSPNATVTRGQFIVLLLNAYGIKPDAEGASNFADAGSTYYTGYLAAAKRLNIANGFEGNRFAPDQTISRQELFTLLHRALSEIGELPAAQAGSASLSSFADAGNISGYADEAFKALVDAGVISGTNGKLLPGHVSSRAEVAQVLYNLLSR